MKSSKLIFSILLSALFVFSASESLAAQNRKPLRKGQPTIAINGVVVLGEGVKPTGIFPTQKFGGTLVGETKSFGMSIFWNNKVSYSIRPVTVTGDAFTVGSNCGGPQPVPSGVCTFPVTFTPTGANAYSGVVSFGWDGTYIDGDGNLQYESDTVDFDVTGSGIYRTPLSCPEQKRGSIINSQDQILREEVPLVGTGFSLFYSSRFDGSYKSIYGNLTSKFGFRKEGWTISVHILYDPGQHMLFFGDGTTSSQPSQSYNSNLLVISPDGTEAYIFTTAGQHLQTLSALTGAVKYTFGYDANTNLNKITDAFGNETILTRGGANQEITKITSPYGQETNFTLNSNGVFTSVTNPKNETYYFTYQTTPSPSLLKTFQKPGGQISTFTFDSNGKLTKDLGHGGNFWELISNSSGVTLKSQMNRQETFAQSQTSHSQFSQTSVDTSGLSTTFSSDDTNASISENLIARNEVSTTPDERFGTLLNRTSSKKYKIGGAESTTTYRQSVNQGTGTGFFDYETLTKTLTVNSRTITSVFDNALKKNTTTSSEGAVTIVKVNAQNQPTEIQQGSDVPTTMTYDTRGRVSQIKQGTQGQLDYVYNPAGYVQKITNARLEETSFIYDLAGRVIQTTLPDSRVIQYGYGPNGDLVSVTPPGRPMHVFEFNAMELPSKYAPPTISGVTTKDTNYYYNLDKQLTQVARPASLTSDYSYNATTGLLESITVGRGQYSYAYSSAISGQLASIQSPDGIKNVFGYRGPLISSDEQIRTSDSVSLGQVSFGFDSDHRVTSRTVKDSAGTLYTKNITLNNDNQPTQVGSMSLQYSYPSGRLSTTTLGNISDERTYDNYGRLASYTVTYSPTSGSPQVLYSYTLSRDVMGRINGKTETLKGVTASFTYTFDTAGRLTAVDKGTQQIASFVYDSNGNRTSTTMFGTTKSATFNDQDRILNFGSKLYSYNDNGDLTGAQFSTGATQALNYDELGNLNSFTATNGSTISYAVDGLNRRVGKSLNGTVQRRFLYEDSLRIAAELDKDGILKKEFVYASGSQTPDYMIKDGVNYKIITDHLGSPVLVVNASTGQTAQRLDYDFFGRVQLDSNTCFQPFGFAGGIWDPDTKLVRFGARDYDPELGRWSSKDAILFAGGDTNLYGYTFQDPVNFIDPSGLTAADVQRALQIAQQALGISGSVNWAFGDLGGDVVGRTNLQPFLPNSLTFDNSYSGELCEGQKRDLLNSVFHELQHYRDGFWKSNFYENFGPQSPVKGISQRHYDIYTSSDAFTDKYINQYLEK